MTTTQFDAIVVGSGITGGWAAKELTEAGLKVLMIERGRNIEHGSGYKTETTPPWDMPFRGAGDAAVFAREYAVQSRNRAFDEWTQHHFVNDAQNPYSTAAEGDAFDWWRSYQLGGRSLTWGRQAYRWSDYDFSANKLDGHGTDWPIRYADLAPWYDKVEEFIGVSGSTEGLAALPDGKFQPPMALNVVEAHVKSLIEKHHPDRRLIIGRTANLTEGKEGRAPCQYRGICARGCSYGAYFSTQSSTLPAAHSTGRLTLLTDCLVEEVVYDPAARRASGVRVLDTATRTRREYSARLVFLNAGAFNSNHLLLRSRSASFPHGLANSSGFLGTHIMDHANTLAAVSLIPGFDDRTTYGNRPTGIVIPRFRNLDRQDGANFTRGYSYQGGALRGAWKTGSRAPGVGAQLKNKLRRPGPWQMVLLSYAECLPYARNRLSLDEKKLDPHGAPLLKIDFKFGDNERAALIDAAAEAKAMLGLANGNTVMSMTEPGRGGTAIHEMGGARMGHDPKTSVLDSFSRAHDVPNLFVTDGAQMSSSACQNPSLTFMALTARACDHAVSLVKQGLV